MKKFLLVLFALFSVVLDQHLCAQNKNIDSLITLLKKNNITGGDADTTKIILLNKLAIEYVKIASYDSALACTKRALTLSDKLGKVSNAAASVIKRELAATYMSTGNVYNHQGDYPKAMDNYLKSLKLAEEIQDKKRIANIFSNIGTIYMDQGDYPRALDYYFKALKIDEELGDKTGMARIFGNIGVLYINMGMKSKSGEKDSIYEKALSYYSKALTLAEELGNKEQVGGWQGNIANGYYMQATDHPNPFQKKELYNKALEYYFKALKIGEEIGDKKAKAVWLGNIGSLYADIKKYTEAEKYLLDAVKIHQEIGAMNEERQFEEFLSELYSKMNRHELALEHYKKAMALKDTLFNENKNKEITRKEMTYEFEKKEAAAKAEQEKKEAVQQSEARRQRIVIWFTVAVAVAVALFALFIYRALKITQKQKQIIAEKNKHITDSINYAKRIQDAILPTSEELKTCFSDHFIFFQPKDIVSGDFYWLSASKNNRVILAIADCTGHGVPGAFMSMIGNTLLNEIVNEQRIEQPSEILNHLNEGIVQALHQESRSQDDGMDISICLFEKDKNKVTFAGANHSLYIVSENSMEVIEGDFYSIGSAFGKKDFSYSQKEVLLKGKASIFLSSDGYSDQRGGAEGKKFSTKLLSKLFVEISGMDGEQQGAHIQNTFNKWKGNYQQMDDILVMGIKT